MICLKLFLLQISFSPKECTFGKWLFANVNIVTYQSKNGLKVADINQKGILGDCWFLSALSSLIVYDQKLIQRVLNVEYNNRNGPTRGKLKARDLEITTD